MLSAPGYECTGQSLRQGRHADVHSNNLLNYVLDELMPWHEEDGLRDFSLLEVNRSISEVREFSRETSIAVIANIELQEWRQQYCTRTNIPIDIPGSVQLMILSVSSTYPVTLLERILH